MQKVYYMLNIHLVTFIGLSQIARLYLDVYCTPIKLHINHIWAPKSMQYVN